MKKKIKRRKKSMEKDIINDINFFFFKFLIPK
jgi:hypothetical protein